MTRDDHDEAMRKVIDALIYVSQLQTQELSQRHRYWFTRIQRNLQQAYDSMAGALADEDYLQELNELSGVTE